MTLFKQQFAIVATILVCGWMMCLTASAQDYVIIANESVSTESISKADLKLVFLGKKKSLGGSNVKVSVFKKADLNEVFTKDVTGKSGKQFTVYWKRQVFAGKASMPKMLRDENQMVSHIKSTKGAIGFVTSADAAAGVKVLTVSD